MQYRKRVFIFLLPLLLMAATAQGEGSGLNRLVQLVVGDWSGDGHNRTEDIYIYSNFSANEIQEARKKATQILGFDFQKEVATQPGNVYLAKTKLEKLRKHNVKVVIEDEEGYKDDDSVPLDIDSYVSIWFGLIKVGNSAFRYQILQAAESIAIGGYGLLE